MSTPSDDDPPYQPPQWQQPEQQKPQEQGGWQSQWQQPEQNQPPEQNQWQQQQTPQWTGYQPAPPTPGNAIASLILGIIGIVLCPIVTSVVGLILGYGAKKEIDNSGGRLGGRGVAMGGIITSWIGLAIYIPIIALIVIGVAVGS